MLLKNIDNFYDLIINKIYIIYNNISFFKYNIYKELSVYFINNSNSHSNIQNDYIIVNDNFSYNYIYHIPDSNYIYRIKDRINLIDDGPIEF